MKSELGRINRWLARGPILWLATFVGFFLVGSGWALATPYNGVPDEINHIIRAAGIARGEFNPDSPPDRHDLGLHHIPKGLAHGDLCWQTNIHVSAACGGEPDGNRELVQAGSTAGRYPPLYYMFVGWPMVIWPSWFGVLLARVISAALSAALLASAAFVAVRLTRHRLLPVALLTAATPISMHLAGSINPNGAEIAAGVAFFASLLPLVLGKAERPPRAALVLAGISGSMLALIRGFGPLWVPIILGVICVPMARSRLKALLGTRAVRYLAGTLIVAFGLAVTWLLSMRTGSIGWVNLPRHMTFWEALRIEMFDRSYGYAAEMIGVMGWTNVWLPGMVLFAWMICLGAPYLLALGTGSWTDRWRLGVLSLLVFAIPMGLDAVNVNTYGFVSQGRYILPIAVGVPLLAAWIIGERRVLSADHTVSFSRGMTLLLVGVHVIALWFTMIRFQRGLPLPLNALPFNSFTGAWLPAVGPVVPLVLAVLGAGVLLVFGWFAPTIAVTEPSSAGPVEAGTTGANPGAETATVNPAPEPVAAAMAATAED